ncbi:MAG TPA: crossover junction endodeoxyribonuclease RuvC [Dehalococcoidia bacterium]|nr:crossover junction endodeoxyribonuclease RuvC [Dehalococcoidia bacterium]
MRVLGIDPGTQVMGYGVVEGDGEELALVDCGALTPPPGYELGQRLYFLFHGLAEVIARHRPQEVAVEEPFVHKNARSALAVGRAQAVAILAAAAQNLPVACYSPRQVKLRVADYGASGKEQVQEMVRLQLGLAHVPQPSDAADALAVAICHLRGGRVAELLAEEG